jgi:ABC-type methionine transport system ATPase subunit
MIFDCMQDTIPLIQLTNIQKVFLIDEVETHALSAVNFEINHGDLSGDPRSAIRVGRAKSHSLIRRANCERADGGAAVIFSTSMQMVRGARASRRVSPAAFGVPPKASELRESLLKRHLLN